MESPFLTAATVRYRAWRWLLLALTSCACAAAHAAQGDPKSADPGSRAPRQLVEQKEAFVKRMLSDSPAVRRIEASGSPEARRYLAGAQQSYGAALRSIRNNDFAAADRQLNEATGLIGKARQLVPDPLARGVEHRARYAQMLASVESLQASYQRHLRRATGRPGGAAVKDAALAKVAQLVDTAKEHANSGRLEQANDALSVAERVLMAGLDRVLGTKTIQYSQSFETPAEEYAHELDRSRSYLELVPIALAEFRPSSDAIREVQHFVGMSHKLREQAQQLAARQDYRAALTALRGAIGNLQSALAAAGLRVPRWPGPE